MAVEPTEPPVHDARLAAGGRRFRFAAGAARIFVIVLTVTAVLYVAYGFGRLFSEWRQLSRPRSTPPATAADFNSMAAVLPLAGQWSFAELDWKLKSQNVSLEQINAQLNALANLPVADGKELPDVSDELFKIISMLRIQPVDRAGNQVYLFDRPDLKAQLVVREVGGKPKVVALAAAYPQRGDEWQLVELNPRQSSVDSDQPQSHLLPLPPDAKRSGGRFADDGRLLLELIKLQSNADELASLWTNQGWEVRPSGLGGPDDFSYLCRRGEEVVYAWSANPRDALENLMLVHSPPSSDTGQAGE